MEWEESILWGRVDFVGGIDSVPMEGLDPMGRVDSVVVVDPGGGFDPVSLPNFKTLASIRDACFASTMNVLALALYLGVFVYTVNVIGPTLVLNKDSLSLLHSSFIILLNYAEKT